MLSPKLQTWLCEPILAPPGCCPHCSGSPASFQKLAGLPFWRFCAPGEAQFATRGRLPKAILPPCRLLSSLQREPSEFPKNRWTPLPVLLRTWGGAFCVPRAARRIDFGPARLLSSLQRDPSEFPKIRWTPVLALLRTLGAHFDAFASRTRLPRSILARQAGVLAAMQVASIG